MDPDDFSAGGTESEESDEVWGFDYEDDKMDELMSWEPDTSEDYTN
jgi:hypothetical protein